jgi:hypothetical protein
VIEEIKLIFQVESATFESNYLGLPTLEGRMTADKFKTIKERLIKRLNSWAEKFMSSGAKDVLIKFVAQAKPTYVMGVFKLSVSSCEAYTKLVRDFWWGDEEDKRKVHWTAWDNLVLPKCMGGLGFRDVRIFNQALLGRQAWRLIQFPESLCARILKAKYFPNCDLIDAVFPADTSQTWKGIEHGPQLLKEGLIWRIADGKRVKFWKDRWIPRESSFRVSGMKSRCRLRWASQFIIPEGNCWDEQLIRRVCHPFDADEMLKIKLPQFPTDDFLAWHFEKYGMYTVRSGYRAALMKQINTDCVSFSSANSGKRLLWRAL